ncbi:peptide chain release factor N(5)-glutamine methyltransferase [Arthrobacter castelli]|uniref:peptide chain release factor N(5)-glutamine methyltransferase n=1 Tax=Arthrobacter castelli TaxID=271431 RepID=UPI0004015A4A|nr:peptide chain release factor N(5)-glutamine methyltransferase [Arthrobacter castelli]
MNGSLTHQSLSDALASGARRLAAAAVPSPAVDAELLAAHLLQVPRGRVRALALADAPAPPGFDDLIDERARRIPLQHLTGTAHFRYVELAVGPGVFVPRPETETVAQLVIDRGRELEAQGTEAPRIVDLGTGSGAIAAAVAQEVPAAEVFAVELSPLAYGWAEQNLAAWPVTLLAGDMAEALAADNGTFDVVVSNPPYIPADSMPQEPEVSEHDPAIALYGGGADGMAMPATAVAAAARLLKPGGWFVMEHAEVQAAAVVRLLQGGQWTVVTTHQDLTGRDRATSAVLQ